MKNELKLEIIDWMKAIVMAMIGFIVINNFVIVNAEIPTGSMRETILEGDRVIAFRGAYISKDPERFDIVIFRDEEDILYIKRVIGLPGETVEVIDGEVFIDGESIAELEDYITEEVPTGSFGSVEVPEDSYFVMGDNRNDSCDSRHWEDPYLHEDNILGRAVFQYFPRFSMLQ